VGVPIAAIDDRARLAAGHLLGVAVGDRFAVAAADAPLAELTVDRVTATESEAHVAWRSPARAWPPGSVAIALERPRERFAVRVIAPATLRPALVAQLIALPWLRVATDDDPEVIAELRVAHGAIVVSDARGPLFPPAPFPASLGEAVRDLENLATERRLHHLRGALDAASLTVELGVVARDGFASAAAHGTAFAPGDRLALRLVNRGAERRFCNVFDIGLRRRIKRLTAETNGLGLAPGATAVVGESPDTGRLLGLELRWPPHLPRDAPRPESFLVVVTDAPADLRVLESAEHLASPPAVVTRGAPSPIQAVFARAAGHTQRGEPPSTLAHTRFAMIWRDFAVLPEP
ncbi:MAG TPA: hypothetical protein VFP84_00685, partial [Kofleriaceae bacterium]|nr:hypothetical protein [Kofleriaceae bacterium]